MTDPLIAEYRESIRLVQDARDQARGERDALRAAHDDWMARVSALLQLLLDDLGHGHHGCNIIERVRGENWYGKSDDERRQLIASLHPDEIGIVIWGGADNQDAGIVVSPTAFDAMFPPRSAGEKR